MANQLIDDDISRLLRWLSNAGRLSKWPEEDQTSLSVRSSAGSTTVMLRDWDRADWAAALHVAVVRTETVESTILTSSWSGDGFVRRCNKISPKMVRHSRDTAKALIMPMRMFVIVGLFPRSLAMLHGVELVAGGAITDSFRYLCGPNGRNVVSADSIASRRISWSWQALYLYRCPWLQHHGRSA